MIFTDRTDAGRRLALALGPYASRRPVILALPNGGTPVAAEVARALGAPLDLVMVSKMRAPGDPDLTVGAVADRGEPAVVWNRWALEAGRVSERSMETICDAALADLERRRRRYVDGGLPANLTGEAVILVDDGVATGASMRAAIKAVRAEEPALLVMAVPVAGADVLASLAQEVDAAVCLESPHRLAGVASCYRRFPRVDDETAARVLEASRKGQPTPSFS